MLRPYRDPSSLARLTQTLRRVRQSENPDEEKQKILEEFSRSNPDPQATPELVFQAKVRIANGGRPVLDPMRKWTKKQRLDYIRSKVSI